jgi:hypothetical protein
MNRNQSGLVLVALLAIGAAACTDRDGPAENFGERLDDAAAEARDRLEDAGDEVRETADEIRDALEDN